jgi:hypothetical protein
MHPNPQGRILPRRILPPGQNGPPGQNPQQRLQMRRPMGQPGQPGQSPNPAQQSSMSRTNMPAQGKPVQPSQSPQSTPTGTTPNKPVEKPKNGDLDDVLKKLKEMGNK